MRLNQGFFDLLNELIRQPSVVGAEHAFFRVLQRVLEERSAKVTWYEGLLVAQGDKPQSAMFSAHIDRHGLMCTGPNEFQYAAFIAGGRSDLLGNSVSEMFMNKIAGRFNGVPVMAYEPWSGVYRGAGTILRSQISKHSNNLNFEVSGLEHLVAGTPVAFAGKLRKQDGRLYGQLDNVLTAAMLVFLFESGFQGTAFFTAQEEAGKSWRYLLEWFRRFGSSTNQLIVVDTSPYSSLEDVAKQDVVLRHSDANARFTDHTTDRLSALCEQLEIKYSFKDEYIKQKNRQNGIEQSLGSTEMGRIIAASGGLVGGSTLQIPTTDYHTLDESASLQSCEAFFELLLAISKEEKF
jgi:putative aminopeptidase FrvX